MKSINLKRLMLPNLPYLLFVYLFDKVGQAARLAPGADLVTVSLPPFPHSRRVFTP